MPAVSVSAVTSTMIVDANYSRTALVISNSDSSANCHIGFGVTVTTNDAYIPPGGNMTLAGERIFLGKINGLSSSGSITVKYSQAAPGT